MRAAGSFARAAEIKAPLDLPYAVGVVALLEAKVGYSRKHIGP